MNFNAANSAQRSTKRQAAGRMKINPELANGSEAFIRDLRDRAKDRLEEIQQQTSQ
jgi:hypothetical protein